MLKLIEKIFTVIMLFYTTAALLPFVTSGSYPLVPARGNLIAIAIQLALYSVAFAFIATRWRSFVTGALKIKPIAVLLLIALASCAWSQDPLLTFRRSILLLATTAFGIYLATRYDVSEQLQLLAWVFGIIIFLSFVFAIFLPQYGIDHVVHEGDWQGVFSQKNALARAMVLATFVFFFARKKVNSVLCWLGIAGCLALLILSHSVTGIIVSLAVLASVPVFKLFRTRFTFGIPTGLFLGMLSIGSIMLLIPVLPDLLAFVNRNHTLTGRTDLWHTVFASILRRPLLGYGFDAFWLGMDGESASILQAIHWPAAHAHNGFLDLWLDMGLVGLVAFGLSCLFLWRRAIRITLSGAGWESLWFCMYLAFFVFSNLTESALVKENSIFWVLYASTAVNLYLYGSPDRVPTETVAEHAF